MLLCSGYNGFQQFNALCSGSNISLTEDILPEFVAHVIPCDGVIISASWSNILLIKKNSIEIFGFANGECGNCISPTPPFKEHIIQGTVSKDGYMFLTETGQVWLFNIENNSWKSLNHLFTTEVISESKQGKIIKISCGETFTSALSDSGMVYCGPNAFSELSGIIDVSCGKEHGLILKNDGTVLTWGAGSRGQLGHGDLESSELPQEVEALSGLKVVKIAAGGWHSAVVTDEGDLYTWGWNKQGQLGFPVLQDTFEGGVSVCATPRPVDLPEDAFIEDVSCGVSHTVIKLKDGSVFGCGWNKWGQLGLKDMKRCDKMTLLQLVPQVSAQRIICGKWSTFIFAS